jgi:hypothetical protein
VSAVATLTRKEMGIEFRAKHLDRCVGPCHHDGGKTIRVGDYACKVDGHGLMHALCAKDYCTLINEEVAEQEADRVLEDELTILRAERIRERCRAMRDDLVSDALLEPIEAHAFDLIASVKR